MSDAKFESGSFSSFVVITKFRSEEGNESSNSDIYPQKIGLTLKKWVFMWRIVLVDPKLTPCVNLSNFQAEDNFFIFLMRKEQQERPPPSDQFR